MDITREEASRFLLERNGFLILTHKRPDGDTIGCAAALCRALRGKGKTAWVLPNEGTTAHFTSYLEGLLAPEGFTPDTVVAVDLASRGLFPQNAEGWTDKVDLCIDHHPSNEKYARLCCVESDKAACGEILYAILAAWGALTPETALPLYLAVSTDTGCFVYANTTANTHRVAAALMETGIDFAPLNKLHFRTKSYTRLRVEGRMIDTLDLRQKGTVALASLSLADLRELEAKEEDLEDIAAVAGQLEGVRTAVTIREITPGSCKLSVRTHSELNASRVCALLGGGGHAQAAGCTVAGTVAEAKEAIMAAIEKVQAEG